MIRAKPISKGRGLSKKQRQQVKRYVSGAKETKAFFTNDATNALSYDTVTIDDLCLVAQGDGDTNRDGQVCDMKSLSIKYLLTGSTVTTVARLLVLQYYSDNDDDALVVSDIFQSGTTSIPFCHTKHTNAHDFKVLYDKRFVLGKSTSLEGSDKAVGTIYIPASKMARKRLKQNGSGTDGFNHIFIVGVSDVTDASGNEPNLAYNAKLSFKDV